MTMDRELRSSKRQRIGATGIDVSVVHSDSQEQLTDVRMSDYKPHKNVPNMDSAKGENDGRKMSSEYAEDNKRHLLGKQNDVTNVHASSKAGRSKGRNDGTNDLLPEHNEKLASTLLSLKETDIPAPRCEAFPKAGRKRLLDSDASAATNNFLDAETCNEKSYDIDEIRQIEMHLLQKLKRYINANGGTIGEGWKVQVTKKNKIIYKVYFSPYGRRFRSMREIARFIGITPKKKHSTRIKEELDDTKFEVNDVSGSGCLNNNIDQLPQITGNLEVDPTPMGSANKAKGSGTQQEASVPHATMSMEDRMKQARPLREAEMQPSSGLSTSGLKEKYTPGIAKASSANNSTKKRQHMHWSELLEIPLKTSSMTTASGIRNQILKVLASDPPEWVKQKLQPSVSTDALDRSASGSLKDVISSVLEEYRGKEVSCKQIVKEKFYEKPVNVRETGKSDEQIVETKSRKKNSDQKAYPSSEVIIERCRNVLQDVTSAEKFGQLCNLVHGSFAGSRTHDVFDFRLIELRMNAGTYGMSPTLFDSDMQQIWKRVREIGQEMIFLADGLTEYSQASYKKQVVTLLEEDVDPEIDDMNMTMKASINEVAVDNDILNEQPQRIIDSHRIIKQNSKMSEIPRSDLGNAPCVSSKNMVDDNGKRLVGGAEVEFKDTHRNAHLSSKKILSMQNTDGCGNGCLEHKQDGVLNVVEVGLSGNQVQCTSCGSNEQNNCIIACNKCQAAYHIYCLSPPLEVIPSTSWYCSCCSEVGKDSFEVHSSSDGKAKMVKEDMNNTAHDVLVSDLEGGPVEMHNAHENGKLDTSREQVQSESNMEECGPQIHGRMDGMQEDREEIGLNINEMETPFHGSKEDSELHDDRLVAKACKICTTGTRDDDHLIQCSNENCLYKFYHLRCLRPPLASVPPPTWYCPSCLCRSCFRDENDDYIVLCDGCDDAYHTYCLKPPLTSIPENNWYCPTCLEKQKRRKGKKVLNPKESAGKLTIRVRPKKATQMQNQSSLQLNKATDLSERNPGSVGQVRSKNSSQIASPLYMHRGPHDFTDKTMKGEMESAVQHEQSQKASQLANSVVEEVAGEASSDASLDDVTENFIVRVRPRHTTKYKTGSESKDAAKRKRKCSEPRRSEV